MNNFSVWYAKDLRSRLLNLPKAFDQKDFVFMGNYEAHNLNELYALLNDGLDTPNPLGSKERQDFIRFEQLHTSMSVGDIAVSRDTGKAYVCASIGWEEVTLG